MFSFEGRFVEIFIIGALALVIIGPKDLPVLMRRLGQFVGRMRAMAAEFRASFDELARQSELDELRKEVEALRNVRPMDVAARAAGGAEAADVFGDIHSGLQGDVFQLHPPMSHQYPSSVPEPVAETPAPEPLTPKPARKPRAPRKPKAEAPQ